MWSKYILYIEAMEITSSSGIHMNNIYNNGCYSRLFEKRQWQSFQISND